ncbi:dockerin type I domain-containing protein [Ruminococcus albus]|uniref:dockerin type I domain-containing protein n=1 Tax=Ruminococcus albus TaxID=1264 RepID=UPI000465E8CD|nr:dockerin type I domain-containing protein [Ruminococcus albus]
MTIRNSWKRVIAGTLAVLVVAGNVPANVGTGGLFVGTSITAYADSVSETHVITNLNFSDYFDENGVLKDTVPEGSVLDFQGEFSGELYNKITINKKVTITSTSDTVAKFDGTATELGADMTFNIVSGADYTTISNLEFLNCRLVIQGAKYVTVDNIDISVKDKRVGSGVGFFTMYGGTSDVVVKNSYIEGRNNGGSSCVIIGKGADHITFENNTIKASGTVGNMFNVTPFNLQGDTNPGYVTLKNNNIESDAGGGISYAIALTGEGHILEGNNIKWKNTAINAGYGLSLTKCTYKNNTVTNGGSINIGSFSTAEGNITDGNVSLQEGAIFTDNTVGGKLTVSQKDTQIKENTLKSDVIFNNNANNTKFEKNNVTGTVTVNNTSKGNSLTENIIVSTGEYAVILRSTAADSNTSVVNNTLVSKDKIGDDAVNRGTGSGNIIQNNDSSGYIVLLDEWVQPIADMTYTGSNLEPEVVVKNDNTTLTQGTDYLVAYKDNKNAGTATLTITRAEGSVYAGKAEKTFTINKADPTPDAVTGLTAAYGKTLEDVALPNGWTWDAPETSVGNAGNNTFSATFTPTDTANYNNVKRDLTVNVTPIPAATTAVDTLNATYGQTLADVTLPTANNGTWTWKDPTTTSVGNAGTHTFTAVFTHSSTNYTAVEQDVTINVAKANPTPEAVTDLNAIYEQTLADVTLPTANDGTWAWKDPTTTSVGNAGTHTFAAVFTPTNTNYNTVEQNVTVNVAKANMTPNPVSERNATYEQTLADVTLPAANDGTWAWKDPTTTSVGNAGTHTFMAVFTPTNTNYNTVEQDVTVKVAKADPTPEAVTGLTAAYGKTLEDVALPNGWTWDATETSVGNVGDNAFAATYTPDDTANYNTLNQDLTVTVVPVNKTALNDALTNANNYLDTIKNDADYAAPSSDLSTAISTVNAVLTNDNVTEAQVAQAITDVNNAVTTAKSDVKDIDDTKAAQAVTNKINALTAAENVSTADKTDIEAARAAYDDLTEDQKAKVSADTLEKLTDAETALAAAEKDAADQAAANDVTSAINDLPAAEDITTADKTDIEAARKAYDELTDDQKAKVSADTLEKLTNAETALAAAEKDAADQVAANDVTSAINDLPAAEDITTADKTDIEAARKAYDELTDDQKAKVSAETKAKLEAAEEALVAAETPIIKGDVNFDGKINVTDIVKIAAHVKGKKLLDKTAARAADVNGDSIIDVTDIIMIAAHIKGKKLL